MITERNFMRGALVLLTGAVLAIGYNQRGARADGVPAMNPMTYSGTLEEAGSPVNGSRNLRLTVWDDATSMESGRIRCITSASGAAVTGGRFQVTLDNACTAAVRSTPDLWIEVEVNGSSLGRTKISAVPFAVEAGRAAELTPAASSQLVPPGTVVAFAGDTAPAGWMLCDGTAVSQTTYPALFRAIGTAHGSGGGMGMFNVPDLRGRFVRGVARGTGRDVDRGSREAANPGGNAGDAVGSLQAGQIQSHTHGVSSEVVVAGGPERMAAGYTVGATPFLIRGVLINAAGGSETRPVNVGLNYIIRY